MSYRNNNNQSKQQSQQRTPCSLPEQLRFPSHGTFSNLQEFLTVTGGDAPWYAPTRNAAIQNSKNFYMRFISNLSKVMGRYCAEMKQYQQSQQDAAAGGTENAKNDNNNPLASENKDGDEDDERPKLPNELRRLCAYVAASYSSQHLLDHEETRKELETLFNDSRVKNNKRLTQIFSDCPVSSESLKSSSAATSSAPPAYTSSVTTAATSTGRISSARAAILAQKEKQEQQKKANSKSPSAATGSYSANNQVVMQQQAASPPPPPAALSVDHYAWVEQTLVALCEGIFTYQKQQQQDASSPSSPPPPALLRRILHEVQTFITSHDSWVQKNWNSNIAKEFFWSLKIPPAVKKMMMERQLREELGLPPIADDNENANDDEAGGGGDDDDSFLQKRAAAKTSSPESPSAFPRTLSSELPQNVIDRIVQSRFFTPLKKPGVEIPLSNNNNNNTEPSQDKNETNEETSFHEQQQDSKYFDPHQSMMQGALANNVRFQSWEFPVVSCANIQMEQLLDTGTTKSVVATTTIGDALYFGSSSSSLFFKSNFVDPFRDKLNNLGNKRTFLEPVMNISPTTADENENEKQSKDSAAASKKKAFVPNIHAKVAAETARLLKRTEWDLLQTTLLAAVRLCLTEVEDICWALQSFLEIVEKAKIVSGYSFRALRAYAFDVDNGRACAQIGDTMEEKTLLNKDFIRGTAIALMRQKPFLNWIAGGDDFKRSVDVVTDWLSYCWVCWTSLEDEANRLLFSPRRYDDNENTSSKNNYDENDDDGAVESSTIDETNQQQPSSPQRRRARLNRLKALRNEQRIRFVELAQRLKKEAHERFNPDGKKKSSDIPAVWVPVTSVELFCLDRRDPNNLACPCISELDVSVVDVSSCLPNEDGKTISSCPLPSAKIELVLEIKYSPCDLIKASNQEVVFARALANTVLSDQRHGKDSYRGFLRLFGNGHQYAQLSEQDEEEEKNPEDWFVPSSDEIGNIGHVAFSADSLPDLVLIRNLAAKHSSSSSHSNNKKKSSSKGGENKSEDKTKDSNNNALLSEKIKIPAKYSELRASNPSSLPPGFAITFESLSDWSQDESKTRFHPTNPTRDASVPRFFLVSTWPDSQRPDLVLLNNNNSSSDDTTQQQKMNDASSSDKQEDQKYFPVYAPLKHFVIRNVAGLLAKGGWKGVEEDPNTNALLKKLFLTAKNENVFFPRVQKEEGEKENNGDEYERRRFAHFLETFTRVLCQEGMLSPKLKSKKQEREYKWRGLNEELKVLANDISQDIPSPMNNFASEDSSCSSSLSSSMALLYNDFIVSVSSVSQMWQKLKKSKGLMTPQEVYDSSYFEKDNILFVRFEKALEKK